MKGYIAHQLNQQIVTEVVVRALDRPAFMVDTWQLQPISYANISPHSRGLYRLRGSGHDGAVILSWSVVLKIFTAPDNPVADDPNQSFFWRREALIYQSGWLTMLPKELCTPRCLGVTEYADRQLWLWLEDVAADDERSWPLGRYVAVARGLGRLGGVWLERSELRATPWLSHGLLRAWVEDASGLIGLLEHPVLGTHALLRELYPSVLVAEVQQLWAERELFLAALERLPQTLCHHDVWRNNLAARLGIAGQPQTVMFDWEVAGLGALGEDPGNLLSVSLLNFDLPANEAAGLAETLLTGYLTGLPATSPVTQQIDKAAVRGAFAATAALRCVFSAACWPIAIVRDDSGQFVTETEQRWQRPIDVVFMQWASLTRFLLEQAAVARSDLGI